MKSTFVQPKPEGRAAILKKRQQMKMSESAHAYVRGNTEEFYTWLEKAKGKVPQGPAVWICGDCHVGNLGAVADAHGKVEIEIRDLDQTVIGNPAHDLIRLALSLAMASRNSDLPGVTAAEMMEAMIAGYCDALAQDRSDERPQKSAKQVRLILQQSTSRKWRHLATERIQDVRPLIPLGPKSWALSKEERSAIDTLFESTEVRELITCLRQRGKKYKIEVLDAAYWMKGCSSLGRLRYAVLVGVGKDFCLIDIKEAVKTVAPGHGTSGIPRDQSQRLVAGARALSPFLGERMLATHIVGHSVVLRELRPQDLKVELDQITRPEAVATARFLAGVVGRAHRRQMKASVWQEWVKRLRKTQTKCLKAPGWLWSSVVELIADHEVAYLEHCRAFSLDNRRPSSKTRLTDSAS